MSVKPVRHSARRWWQRLCRLAVVLVLVLAGAYVSLPWWAPTGLLRQRLASDLSYQAGVPVTVEALTLSWGQGIQIRGFRVAGPNGTPAGPLLQIGHIRADLSPLDFLFRRRLAWMDLEDVQLAACVDGDGNANLAPLGNLSTGLAVGDLSVRRARVLLNVQGHDRQLRLDVRDLRYAAGRLQRLGHLTMSAVLDPQGVPAPVSLHVATGLGEETAANATFNFDNLDLSQLALPHLLGLPLRALSGRCKGSLNLHVTSQGLVDHFGFDLGIANLDVQPDDGPRIPVIETAHVRIDAEFDPINRQIKVQSASILMPGIDLSGKAELAMDLQAGQWEAINSLDLDCTIDPVQLAGVLTGKGELPGGFLVAGPVGMKIKARHERSQVKADLALDLGKAEIRRRGTILKPAGRAMALRLAGALDDRNWDLAMDELIESRLSVGENSLTLAGRIHDIRRLADRATEPTGQGAARAAASVLSLLDCRGDWQVSDLQALRDLLPDLQDALRDVALQGRLAGQWAVRPGPQGQVLADLKIAAPVETIVSVGRQFDKPAGKAAQVTLAAVIEPDRPTVSQADLELAVGAGKLRVVGGRLQSDPSSAEGLWQVTCPLELQSVEDLLSCVPALAEHGVELSGAASGRCELLLGPGFCLARTKIDLSPLALRWRDRLTKPAGQPWQLQAEWSTGKSDLAAQGLSLRGTLSCVKPAVEAMLTVGLPRGAEGPAGPGTRLQLSANAEAEWLVGLCPLLKDRLGRDELSGAVSVLAACDVRDRSVAWDAAIDGWQLQYASAGPVRRTKAAGVPMSLALRGKLLAAEGRSWRVEMDKAEIALADSSVRLSGSAGLTGELAAGERPWPQPAVADLSVEMEGAFAFDAALAALVPEAGAWMDQYSLAGKVSGRLRLVAGQSGVGLSGHVNAQDASAGPIVLFPPGELPAEMAWLGPVRKPRSMPARADFQCDLPADLSRVKLNDLRVHLGNMELSGDAQADLDWGREGLPVAVRPKTAHLAVMTGPAEELVAMMPSLESVGLSGRALLETEVKDGKLLYLVFHGEDLRGRMRGKDLSCSGQARLRDVRLEPDGAIRVGQASTEGLFVRIGASRAWMVLDLSDIPAKPAGSVTVLAESVDEQELAEFLSGSAAPATQKGKLTAKDIAALQKKAQDRIAAVRPLALAADVQARLTMDRLRTFDAQVQRAYDLHQVQLDVTIRNGQLEATYGAGTEGGAIQARHAVNFAELGVCLVSQTNMRDVIATENMQPQLGKFFPGNTVYGTFSRTENLRTPLQDLLAGGMDVRYPVRSVGTAKTVTLDGLLEGRAAPKFVTAVFPGLNLAKYRYNQMTAFAEYHGDGVAENDMVFSGPVYDMYIEGTTDADNIGRYTIGVILVGNPQSPEWNHDWRAGRIPILQITARIEGGKMHDESVSYLPPYTTLRDIFIRNNPVNRILVNAQK